MSEFTVEAMVEFGVECDECGATLQASESTYKGSNLLSVEPCTDCLATRYEEGFGDGKDDE